VGLSALGGIHPEAVVRVREQAGHLLVRSTDELRVVSDEHRSQHQNREACLGRLRALIEACESRPKVRRKTRPTRASKERRLKHKKQQSEKKQNRRWDRSD
jgi:ribosome-associated protein